jgi:hypothetical protein
MARKLRVEYPGAIYHVMNRGDRREPLKGSYKISIKVLTSGVRRVSQAIGVVKRDRDRNLERLRRKLIQLESKPQ